MLPFLKANKMAAVIIAKRKPDGSTEAQHEEGEYPPALMAVAEDLISAIHMKDAKAVASALLSADEIMDAEQGESESEEEGMPE